MGVQKHYIGETFTAYNGMKFTIINIDRASKKPYTIQFEDGYITNINNNSLSEGAYIKNGNLANIRKIDRTGEQNRHQDGSLMTIIDYKDSKHVLVKFEDSYTVKTNYKNFIDGACTHKIRLFNKYYSSIHDICISFNINSRGIVGKSSIEIEKYIANNKIEYNGQWMSLGDYVKEHGVIPVNFYKYLRANNIEKNAANVKRYIPHYLEVIETKIETEKVHEMQKLKYLMKRYNKPATDKGFRTRATSEIYNYLNSSNLSAEQVIVHFRPDLHINIFGKIVDENGNEV